MENEICHIHLCHEGTIVINQKQSIFLSGGHLFLANALLEIIMHNGRFNMNESAPFIKRFAVFYDISTNANYLRATNKISPDMLNILNFKDIGVFKEEHSFHFSSFYDNLNYQQKALVLSIILGNSLCESEARCVELIADELYFDVERRANILIRKGMKL